MTAPIPSPPLLLSRAEAGVDARPRLATLFGADFSALSITPARGDLAPAVTRSALERFAPYHAPSDTDLLAWHVVDVGDAGARTMEWQQAFATIERLAASAFDDGVFVIALGGDHSVTYPIGVALASRCARIGIIQLDVHHDVRPIGTTPSNGSPIRGLIEHGKVAGCDVVQIGIHPFANRAELAGYCDEQGIHRVSLEQLAADGTRAAIDSACELLAGCDHIHLTVDIDVLDRAYAPGTVAALPGGISPAQLASLVDAACQHEAVQSMDVVEFDPERDVSSVTAYNVAQVVMVALSAVARRRSER